MSQSRKHPKQIGLNIELAKKERERKYFKLGKERRAHVIQRHRKVMDDNNATDEIVVEDDIKETMTANAPGKTVFVLSDKRMRRMLEMRELLFDQDPSVHHPACVYFRKALAIDKHPPLELVYSCGAIPRLVELLERSCDDIQYECAWSLTNMACGEKHHLEAMLETGIVPLAMNIMVASSSDDVREQCLWLICNLASSPEITRDTLLKHGVMSYLHSFMLLSPKQSMEIDIPTSPSLSKPLYDIEDAFRNYLEHHGVIELPKTPSLLAMNHVANLVSYLVRKDLALPSDNSTVLSIVHMAPTLLQSPDENVLLATCTTLINIFDGNCSCDDGVTTPTMALQLAMEKGVLKRMKDICLATSSSDSIRQVVLCVLGCVLKTENPLYRLTVLQKGQSHFYLLEWIVSQIRKAVEIDHTQEKAQSRSEFFLHILNCVSVMLLESSENIYADELIQRDFHHVLIAIIDGNSNYDLASQVGRCLCSLLLRGSVSAINYIGPTLFPLIMTEMLSSPDMHLLLLALSSIWHLLEYHNNFDFLLEALGYDSLYDIILNISMSSTDEEITTVATRIINFADRLREED